MKPTSHVVVAMLTALLLLVGSPDVVLAEKGPLEGAWKLVEQTYTSPDTSMIWNNRHPGLFIFSKEHYSIMYTEGTEPRALFAGEHWNGTDAEKLEAYDTVIANSGTYEVAGSTLTLRTVVAKWPNFMVDGYVVHEFKIQGDTLHLVRKSSWRGITPGSRDEYKLTRLEE